MTNQEQHPQELLPRPEQAALHYGVVEERLRILNQALLGAEASLSEQHHELIAGLRTQLSHPQSEQGVKRAA
jgi:hypothetical protein